jgi:hypothetical protein
MCAAAGHIRVGSRHIEVVVGRVQGVTLVLWSNVACCVNCLLQGGGDVCKWCLDELLTLYAAYSSVQQHFLVCNTHADMLYWHLCQ